MTPVLELATENDAAAIVKVRAAAARELTARFGKGPWSITSDTEAGVRLEVLARQTFIARSGDSVIATLRLSLHNPWLGDTGFFTPREKPIFLTAMAVAPHDQRRGVGRSCLRSVDEIARFRHADSIRLDAHDAPAGAGDFYRKCGYREVHRGDYLGTPLIWFERLLEA